MEQTVVEQEKQGMKSLRFGGISPVVLRELSGVYQPFVKAVKEIISNAYDADAEAVGLYFKNEFSELTITDNGSGMNPIEFVRDYIRIGKSLQKEGFTSKKQRPRIGGKGIGFLAPARYCDYLVIRTKKAEISRDKLRIEIGPDELSKYELKPYLLRGHSESEILNHITITRVTNAEGQEIKRDVDEEFRITFPQPQTYDVWYEFDSSSLVLTANINFDLLFSLDPSKSLEEIENFCQIRIEPASERELDKSFTEITLHEIKDFVRDELSTKGKKGARNIESTSGIDQFLWNLSRIIPIRAELHDNLPDDMKKFIRTEIDGEEKGYPIEVNCGVHTLAPKPLERYIMQPDKPMSMTKDADIIKELRYDDDEIGFSARGFLMGSSSTIYPAECRGILLRVKGVAIGEPTFFGLDQILTGSAKVALSQISGEINILSGVDAIHDINPGRDGFYKESGSYNFIKKRLIGNNPEKLMGDLKDVIDAIITRSEVNASITNFVKKHEGQRKAILEASAAIGELAYEDPYVFDQFFTAPDSYELHLSGAVQYKAEGKLASFTVKVVDNLSEQYKIDYVEKELLLSSDADIWMKNINIGGTDFELVFKHGKQKKLFCEVNPNAEKIYINWDHPLRGTMGDAGYIKHCLATVASALPQEQLNTYIKLITNKI